MSGQPDRDFSPLPDHKPKPERLPASITKLIESEGRPYFENGKNRITKLNELFWAAYFKSIQEHLLFEDRKKEFFSYDKKTGVFIERSIDSLRTDLAELIMESACTWGGDFWQLKEFRNEHSMRGVLTHLRGKAEEHDPFSNRPEIIHCANCVLERKNGYFAPVPFSPKYRSLASSPVAFKASAECPKFEEMILVLLCYIIPCHLKKKIDT